MDYSERLKHARKLRGMTQHDLEERSGVSQQAISHIESGKRGPSALTFELARALAVNPDWLGTGRGDPDTTPQFGNERVPIIRWANIVDFIENGSVKPEGLMEHYLLEGRSLFALPSSGIINFKNPLGQVAKELLVVDFSKKRIDHQMNNLEFLDPLHRIAIVNESENGPVARVLTPIGNAIHLEDPTERVAKSTLNPKADTILGIVVEIVTQIGG